MAFENTICPKSYFFESNELIDRSYQTFFSDWGRQLPLWLTREHHILDQALG